MFDGRVWQEIKTYDALDNLIHTTVSGRDHLYWYDAKNRLTNVLNGPGGPDVIGLGNL